MKAKQPKMTPELRRELRELLCLRPADSDSASLWQRWLAFEESAAAAGIDRKTAWHVFWSKVEQMRRRQRGQRMIGRPSQYADNFAKQLVEVEQAIRSCLKKDRAKEKLPRWPTQQDVAVEMAVAQGKDRESVDQFSEQRKLQRWLGSMKLNDLTERVAMELLEDATE